MKNRIAIIKNGKTISIYEETHFPNVLNWKRLMINNELIPENDVVIGVALNIPLLHERASKVRESYDEKSDVHYTWFYIEEV